MVKRGVKIAIVALIVLVAIALIYFYFFYSESCKSLSCFQARQKECAKASLLYDTDEATWLYKIQGVSEGKCNIYVEAVQIKKGTIDKQKLNGKGMNCYIPLGSISSPEEDLSVCTGVLKEELQELMIQRLHSYIVTNIGKINDELKKMI